MATAASKPSFKFRPQYLVAGACFIVAATLLLLFFRSIPFVSSGMTFAGDWKLIWESLGNGHIQYSDSLHIPPWDVLLILPLSFLTVRDSWSLLALFTLCVLLVSVPRLADKKSRWRYWVAVLLLVTSYLDLRELVDGNFEGLIIGGVLLLLYGYRLQQPLTTAAGLLIMIAKPQESWLLFAAAGILLLKTWPRPKLLRLGMILAVVVIPCLLWIGPEWVSSMLTLTRGLLINVVLGDILRRIGVPTIGIIVAWLFVFAVTFLVFWRSTTQLNRQKAGLLLCASLLLAPFAEANSFLTVMAVSVIPLFLRRPLVGIVLIVLVDVPFFISPQAFGESGPFYWFAVILLTWGILAWYVYTTECRPKRAVPDPLIEPPITVSA